MHLCGNIQAAGCCVPMRAASIAEGQTWWELQHVSTRCQVKIGDFGLAKVMSSRCSQKIDLQKEGNINKDSDDKSCPSPRLCGYLNLNNRY